MENPSSNPITAVLTWNGPVKPVVTAGPCQAGASFQPCCKGVCGGGVCAGGALPAVCTVSVLTGLFIQIK